MLTKFSHLHQNKQLHRGRIRPKKSRLFVVGGLLLTLVLLILATTQSFAQETIPYETYLVRISIYRTDIKGARGCTEYWEVADKLESITAVQMPNGAVMPVEHNGADEALRQTCNANIADQYLAALCPPGRCQPGEVPAAPQNNFQSENSPDLQEFLQEFDVSLSQETGNDAPVSLDDGVQQNFVPNNSNENPQLNNPNAAPQTNQNTEANNPTDSGSPEGSNPSDAADSGNGTQGEGSAAPAGESGGEENAPAGENAPSDEGAPAGETAATGETGTEGVGDAGTTGEEVPASDVSGAPSAEGGTNGSAEAPPPGAIPDTQNPQSQPGSAESSEETAVSTPTPTPEDSLIEGVPNRTLLIITILSLIFILILGIVLILMWPVKEEPKTVPKRKKPTTTVKQELAEGRKKMKEGDYREAVRKLFIAILITLDEHHIIQFDATLTNHEILRHAILRPSLIKPLIPIVNTYERVWYGFESIKTAEYDSLVTQIEQLRTTSKNGDDAPEASAEVEVASDKQKTENSEEPEEVIE